MLTDALRALWQERRSAVGTDSMGGLSGWRTFEVPLAGVTYHGEGKPALRLRLRERIWLKREPENPHDAYAVVVLNQRGKSIGHLPRYLARQISPALTSGRACSSGSVTGLRSDPAGNTVGVTIALSVERELGVEVAAPLEFAWEEGAEGSAYVLLNSDSAILNDVQEGLAGRGLACERVGQAFRPASDGNTYQWYIRMGPGVGREAIEKYFTEAHGASPWRPSANEDVNDYAQAFDGELAAKDGAIAELSERLRESREQVGQARQEVRRTARESLMAFVGAVLPQVDFVRDSLDVLSQEVAEPEGVLREVHAICCTAEGVPAKTVQGAPGWRELHFNTGQRDNGRLYFKREGGRVSVLISFKGVQEKDIQYLKTK